MPAPSPPARETRDLWNAYLAACAAFEASRTRETASAVENAFTAWGLVFAPDNLSASLALLRRNIARAMHERMAAE